MSRPPLERLQKAIARSGFASRRRAEQLIAAGSVTIDGRVARLGDKVDPTTSRIAVDGARVPVRPGMVYYLLNKPSGVISSVSDPQGRPVVVDLVPDFPRVWPVGRLDLDSEGLLILTNDGDLTNLLTHPRNRVPKRYTVLVKGSPVERTVTGLVQGVALEDGWASAREARVVDRARDRTLLEVVMTEGRKREIRRMCAALGMPVLHLFRSAIGPVSDATLRPGRWRLLSPREVVALYGSSGAGDTSAVTSVIAIDGPGGSGKTTVSRRVADILGLAVLDTGAFYRAATLAVLGAGVDPSSPEGTAVVAGSRFEMVGGAMMLDGEDVGERLRSIEVDEAVSAVSAVSEIRRLMVGHQRSWVDALEGSGAVVEGRDIGTVVFPEARLKVFLTARPEVRAERRTRQQPQAAEAGADLERRDRHDSTRQVSPLTPAPDAVEIDTTDLPIEEVVARVVDLARARGF